MAQRPTSLVTLINKICSIYVKQTSSGFNYAHVNEGEQENGTFY